MTLTSNTGTLAIFTNRRKRPCFSPNLNIKICLFFSLLPVYTKSFKIYSNPKLTNSIASLSTKTSPDLALPASVDSENSSQVSAKRRKLPNQNTHKEEEEESPRRRRQHLPSPLPLNRGRVVVAASGRQQLLQGRHRQQQQEERRQARAA